MEDKQDHRTPDGLAPSVAPVAPNRDTKIKAVILAAGRGSRLGGAADSVPKCLLEIGRRHLVEHQLEALADAGVGPTALVVGYAAEDVRETVGIRAEYLVNTRWNRTNSLYSFWLAREWMTGPVVILNSDVLFAPEILERLLEAEGDAIAIDSDSGHAREQMKVRVVEGRLEDMRKDLPLDEVSGENVGILKLSADTVRALVVEAQALVDAGDEKAWLGSAVREVARKRPIGVVDVAGQPWVEIDFPTDLNRARKEVLPAIERARARRRSPRRLLPWLAVPLVLAGVPGLARLTAPVPDQGAWEVVLPDSSVLTQIHHGGQRQHWWLLEADTPISVSAAGPGPLRIESRLLDPGEGAHYVLEVEVDGECLDWYTNDTRPSGKATHTDYEVGRKRRILIDMDEGAHNVVVRLIAPSEAGCLVRFRQLEFPVDED